MVGLPDQSLMLLFGRRRGRAGGAKRTRRAHASARTAFSSFPAELRARPVLALWLQQQTGHQVLPCMTTLFQHIVVRRGSTTGYPVISSCARVRVWVPPTAHLTAAAALQLCQYAVMAQAPRSKEKTRCITNHGKDHECATPHTTPLSLGLHWPPMPCHAHCHVYRPAGMSCTWLQYGGGLHDVVSMKRRRTAARGQWLRRTSGQGGGLAAQPLALPVPPALQSLLGVTQRLRRSVCGRGRASEKSVEASRSAPSRHIYTPTPARVSSLPLGLSRPSPLAAGGHRRPRRVAGGPRRGRRGARTAWCEACAWSSLTPPTR